MQSFPSHALNLLLRLQPLHISVRVPCSPPPLANHPARSWQAEARAWSWFKSGWSFLPSPLLCSSTWDVTDFSSRCFYSLVPLTPGQWDVKSCFWLAHNFHQPLGCGKVLLMFDFSTTNLLNFSGLSITNINKSSTEKIYVNLHLNLFQAVLCPNHKWSCLRVRQCWWCAGIAACHSDQCCFIGFALLCFPLPCLSSSVPDMGFWQTERLQGFSLCYISF